MMIVYVFELSVATMAAGGPYAGILCILLKPPQMKRSGVTGGIYLWVNRLD